MPAVLEVYDKALHEAPAPSVQMAQRLLERVKHDISSQRLSREEVHSLLEQLYDYYAENDCIEEREAVADVLDVLDGWAPLGAMA